VTLTIDEFVEDEDGDADGSVNHQTHVIRTEVSAR